MLMKMVTNAAPLFSNPRQLLLSGQSQFPRPPSVRRCDKLQCYYDCRLSLAGGGECGRAGSCHCYQRDGVQRRADNIWYELSRLQQQQIRAAESESEDSEGSGGGEEDNYYDQEYQEEDDDDDTDGEGGDGGSWWSG